MTVQSAPLYSTSNVESKDLSFENELTIYSNIKRNNFNFKPTGFMKDLRIVP